MATGALSLGFGQLDQFITRKIQEGNTEEAFRALDEWEATLGQQMTQGGGVLPTGPRDLVPSNDQMAKIQQSDLASRMAFQSYNQALQNDPYYVAQEQARKQQEAITNARAGAFEGLARQRDVGTETIGPGIMGSMDFTAPQLQESHATGLGMGTAAQEAAREPYRNLAMQRSIQLKQTPTYAQVRGGGSGDGGSVVNTIGPSFQNTVVNNLMKRYPALFRQQAKDERGQPAINLSTGLDVYEPSPAALQVAQEIADEYARTKKPNYMKIETQAVQRFKKAQGDEASQMPPKPTALQNLPRPEPKSEPKTTPLPTALPNISSTQKSRPTMQALIEKAKGTGWTDVQIRNAIKEEGYDPKEFGY